MRSMAVHVDDAVIEPSGLRVVRVRVDDESDADPRATAEVDAMLALWDVEITAGVGGVRPRPGRGGVEVSSLTGVAARLYSSPGMASWSSRLVSGGALANALMPHRLRLIGLDEHGNLFGGPRLSDRDRRLFLHSLDGRAARARARVQQWLAARTLLDVNRPQRWTSVGCAASLPMVGALVEAAESGSSVAATFLDTCDDSREFARRALRSGGFDADAHRVLDWRMASRVGLDGVMGEETQDLVDLVAATDLLGDNRAVALIRQAYATVKPGGVLLFSVTRADRPLRALIEYGVGWTGSHPRTLEDVARLVAAAGIDVRDAMAHLTPEGVHAVVEVRKL